MNTSSFLGNFPGVGLDGEPVTKSKYDFPYSYDCHVIWQDDHYPLGHNFLFRNGHNFLYSDRMLQWDFGKFNRCAEEVWGNSGQLFSSRKPAEIERFLQMYLGNPDIQLLVIGEGANPSSGYPYWVFGYKQN